MKDSDHLELLFLRAQCKTADAILEMIVERLAVKEAPQEKVQYIEALIESGMQLLTTEKLIHLRRLHTEAEVIDIRS